jgi:uncharacterized membrane protein
MTYYLKLYSATLLTFLVIDLFWLGVVARGFYQKQLGFLFAPKPNWFAALVFYLLFIGGLLFFVVAPGVQAHSLRTTALRAALFGLLTYGTYDLTNLATLKDWPLAITVVDMIWGVVLSVTVSAASFLIGNWIQPGQ